MAKKRRRKKSTGGGHCKVVRRCGRSYRYCWGRRGIKPGFPKRVR